MHTSVSVCFPLPVPVAVSIISIYYVRCVMKLRLSPQGCIILTYEPISCCLIVFICITHYSISSILVLTIVYRITFNMIYVTIYLLFIVFCMMIWPVNMRIYWSILNNVVITKNISLIIELDWTYLYENRSAFFFCIIIYMPRLIICDISWWFSIFLRTNSCLFWLCISFLF
jgi:hypothetical protein